MSAPNEPEDAPASGPLSRRNLLAGLGAVGGGMVLTGGLAQAASAEGSAGSSGDTPVGAGTRGTDITSTIA